MTVGPVNIVTHFILAFLHGARIITGQRPNSLVVKHVLGKDESQVRFLLRAPEFFSVMRGFVMT